MYRHREEQEERLKAAIEAAINGGAGRTSKAKAESHVPHAPGPEAFDPVSLDEAEAGRSLTSWPPRKGLRYLVDMHLPEAQPDLRRMIMEVVEVEGPIEEELLLRRVREAWGVGRAGQRIRAAFFHALHALEGRRDVNRVDWSFIFTRPARLAQCTSRQVIRRPLGPWHKSLGRANGGSAAPCC